MWYQSDRSFDRGGDGAASGWERSRMKCFKSLQALLDEIRVEMREWRSENREMHKRLLLNPPIISNDKRADLSLEESRNALAKDGHFFQPEDKKPTLSKESADLASTGDESAVLVSTVDECTDLASTVDESVILASTVPHNGYIFPNFFSCEQINGCAVMCVCCNASMGDGMQEGCLNSGRLCDLIFNGFSFSYIWNSSGVVVLRDSWGCFVRKCFTNYAVLSLALEHRIKAISGYKGGIFYVESFENLLNHFVGNQNCNRVGTDGLTAVTASCNSWRLWSMIENRVLVYDHWDPGGLKKKFWSSNGSKSISTAKALPFLSKKFSMKLADDDDEMSIVEGRDYSLVIRYDARADLCHLFQFLDAKQADAPQAGMSIDFPDIRKPQWIAQFLGKEVSFRSFSDAGKGGVFYNFKESFLCPVFLVFGVCARMQPYMWVNYLNDNGVLACVHWDPGGVTVLIDSGRRMTFIFRLSYSGKTTFLTETYWLLFGTAVGIGNLFACSWLFMFNAHTNQLIKMVVNGLMATLAVISILCFSADHIFWGIVFSIDAVVQFLYVISAIDRFPFTLLVLQKAEKRVWSLPKVMKVAYIFIVVTLLWLVLWSFGVSGKIESGASDSGTWWFLVILFVSLFWKGAALHITVHLTVYDEMNAVLAVKWKTRLGFGMWTEMHITRMYIDGKVLVVVKFLRQWRFSLRLRLCFVEPAYFQMIVKPIFIHGIDVTKLPRMAGWLDKLAAVIEQSPVEHNMLVVDVKTFASFPSDQWLSRNEKRPIAFVRVEVLEAVNMKSCDLNSFADPYVKCQIGQLRVPKIIQKKTWFPKWHEEFKILICTWGSPSELFLAVRDKDHLYDDTIRDCYVSVSELGDHNTGKMNLVISLEYSVLPNVINPSSLSWLFEDGKDDIACVADSTFIVTHSDISQLKEQKLDKSSKNGSSNYIDIMDDFPERVKFVNLSFESNGVVPSAAEYGAGQIIGNDSVTKENDEILNQCSSKNDPLSKMDETYLERLQSGISLALEIRVEDSDCNMVWKKIRRVVQDIQEDLHQNLDTCVYEKIMDSECTLPNDVKSGLKSIGEHDNQGEGISSDCLDENTLLENGVQFDQAKGTSTGKCFPALVDNDLNAASPSYKVEEFYELKEQWDMMLIDLARRNEIVEQKKLQLEGKEKLIFEWKSHFMSKLQDNDLELFLIWSWDVGKSELKLQAAGGDRATGYVIFCRFIVGWFKTIHQAIHDAKVQKDVNKNGKLGVLAEREWMKLNPSSDKHHLLLANVFNNARRVEDVIQMSVASTGLNLCLNTVRLVSRFGGRSGNRPASEPWLFFASGDVSAPEYCELGAVMRRKFYPAAKKYLQQTIEKWDPNDQDLAQVYNALGVGYVRDEKPHKAVAQFETAVKLQPGYVTAWNNLGDAYERKKDLDAALKAFEEVLLFVPNNQGARPRRDALKDPTCYVQRSFNQIEREMMISGFDKVMSCFDKVVNGLRYFNLYFSFCSSLRTRKVLRGR